MDTVSRVKDEDAGNSECLFKLPGVLPDGEKGVNTV